MISNLTLGLGPFSSSMLNSGWGWGILPKKSVLGPVDVFRPFSTFFDLFSICFMFVFWGDCANPGKIILLSVGRWVVVGPSFFRVHLFVTTRVAIKDENFLIGAPFDSDRPRHLFFRPKKSVLGPPGVSGHVSTIFVFFSVFFPGGTSQILEEKKVLSVGRWVVGPWPYGPNDNPIGPYITL